MDLRWTYPGTVSEDGHADWGPYPGDRLAPPPTPQAPEVEMSPTWPWVAAAAVVGKILALVLVAVLVIGFIAHWW